MTNQTFNPDILYAHKTIASRARCWLYRILAQGPEWVTAVINDGMVPGRPVTIDVEQFKNEFDPTTERIEGQ